VSDGVLTEWLFKREYIKPNEFISVDKIESNLPVNTEENLILGNNWYEFGVFSLKRYEEFLHALQIAYPNAKYFPHPKEVGSIPGIIFGEKLIKYEKGIESYCAQYGIPRIIIGFLGSTAMVSLGKLATSKVEIDAINISSDVCDGPSGDITDPLLLSKRSIRITLSDLADTVEDILKYNENVSIKKKSFSLAENGAFIQ
jgi:hypothetical protein